jgi:hypothetical protein
MLIGNYVCGLWHFGYIKDEIEFNLGARFSKSFGSLHLSIIKYKLIIVIYSKIESL